MKNPKIIAPNNNISLDVLVIGRGGAGLTSAYFAREEGVRVGVTFIDKGASPNISSINILDLDDDEKLFAEDIVKNGEKINNNKLVWKLVNGSRNILPLLKKINIPIKSSKGIPIKRWLAGSSEPRSIFSSLQEQTIGETFIEKMFANCLSKGVNFYPNIKIIKLIIKDRIVYGAVGIDLNKGSIIYFNTKSIILATGGLGQVYLHSTYPSDIKGDGYFLAYEAGCNLVDMEFIQFEPLVINYPESARGIVLPTALLADGANLKNNQGESFLLKHKSTKTNIFTKQLLTFSIYNEIKLDDTSSHGAVYLDLSGLPNKVVKNYSRIINKCLKYGVDITKSPVEISPSPHSTMGGIRIKEDCTTAIKGLFAVGEAAGGLHGAGRMAGNSGTEFIVFGINAGIEAANWVHSNFLSNGKKVDNMIKVPDGKKKSFELYEKIQLLLYNHAGLSRNQADLEFALKEIDSIINNDVSNICINTKDDLINYFQLNILAIVSKMVLYSAIIRKESRGFHHRIDSNCGNKKSEIKNVFIRNNKGQMLHSFR